MRKYTKEEFLKAAELGEVSMIDAKNIVSLLDEVKMTRKEYQKQYQKDYADSGKKKEAQKRYYQKHKYEICRKLRAKRFIDKIPDISFPADNYDLDAELEKHGCIKAEKVVKVYGKVIKPTDEDAKNTIVRQVEQVIKTK
jgi:hypothetical protein